MKTRTLFLTIAGLLILVETALAYEIETHAEMSKRAAQSSVLTNAELLRSLGLNYPIDSEQQKFPNSKNQSQTIIDVIQDGARFEDSGTRPGNHFYNPLTGQGIGGLFFSSPDWALEDKGNIGEQELSYQDARQYFYDALTKGSKDERERNFGRTFETLGHVIHHIQDMAQPQHVRNDLHCDLIFPCKIPGGLFGKFYNPSLYEKWSFRNCRG